MAWDPDFTIVIYVYKILSSQKQKNLHNASQNPPPEVEKRPKWWPRCLRTSWNGAEALQLIPGFLTQMGRPRFFFLSLPKGYGAGKQDKRPDAILSYLSWLIGCWERFSRFSWFSWGFDSDGVFVTLLLCSKSRPAVNHLQCFQSKAQSLSISIRDLVRNGVSSCRSWHGLYLLMFSLILK